MNCEHDELGIVDMDAVMSEHHQRIMSRLQKERDEHTVHTKMDPLHSQECVGTQNECKKSPDAKMPGILKTGNTYCSKGMKRTSWATAAAE